MSKQEPTLKEIFSKPENYVKIAKGIAKLIEKRIIKLKDKLKEQNPETKQQIITNIKKTTTYKTIKEFKDWALKNNKNKALVLSSLILLSGVAVHLNKKQTQEIKKEQNKEMIRLNNLENILSEKHKITDRRSFDSLLEKSFPLIQTSFLTSEVLIKRPYTDNGKVINTVGAGSYWYPENGNPESSKWILTKEYFKNKKDTVIDGNHAMDLIKGWFYTREGGRINNNLYKRLKGTELSISEFVAICGVMYNSEKAGKKLCKILRENENYNKPFEIAKCMMNLKYDKEFEKGMLRRNAAQSIGIILEHVDHCVLRTKKIGNTYTTAISVLPLELCQNYKKALNNNDTTHARLYAEQIEHSMTHWLCRHDENGQPAFRQAQKEISNGPLLNAICNFAGDTLNVTGNSPYWGDILYDQAREYHEQGKFKLAAKNYETLFEQGFFGADLHMDAATTYYELGEYKKCREQCKKALTGTTETHKAPSAYLLASQACKELGDTTAAEINKRNYDSLMTKKREVNKR